MSKSPHYHSTNRFDKVPVGSVVTTYEPREDLFQDSILVARSGEGDDREITLASRAGSGDSYTWGIYRHKGRWSLGTSADPIQLVGYIDPVGVLQAVGGGPRGACV